VFWREHPVVSAVIVSCTIAGTVAGVLYLPTEWTLLRRAGGGAAGGAGVGFLFTFSKMY